MVGNLINQKTKYEFLCSRLIIYNYISLTSGILMKIITGYMRVMSSPSGFKSSYIDLAHGVLISGSMAQKNLLIILVNWILVTYL